jgi:UDP-N-acetyl-D-glucosamine dehydrogenase
MQKLKKKILSKKATIAVLGLGYVGLPLAVSFAKAGFFVFGLDKNKARAQRIKQGKNYNEDVSLKDIAGLIKKKAFDVSSDLSKISHADIIIICVPTPLKKKYTPDVSYLLGAVKDIAKYFKSDSLIILESTTYPGTTEELVKPLLECQGLKAGRDFYLAFSPERIDPGNKKYPVTRIPKIVGGFDKDSSTLTKMLYQKIISKVHVVSSAKTAEMVKLVENTFRLVNIGWINEATMMCHRLGINIWEVIEAAKTKPFGFMPFYPSLGVGGHCIPDDPLYLYWKARNHGIRSKFIKLSADINDQVPFYVLSRIESILNASTPGCQKAKLLVVGATYKKDVKDLRRSSAVKFIEILKSKNYKVGYYDPLVPYIDIRQVRLKSIRLNKKNLQGFDGAIIAVAHSQVDYSLILDQVPFVFDVCHVYRGVTSPKIFTL